MREWYRSLSNPVKAALNTAWQSFAAAALLAVLGLLSTVQEWVNNGGDFPDVSIAAKAVVSAAVAAVAGLITFAVRAIQANSNPAAGPKYSGSPPN